jgi:hypothetical protein
MDLNVTDGTDAYIVATLAFFKPGFHSFYWALGLHNFSDKEAGQWDDYFYPAPDDWMPQHGDIPYLSLKNLGGGESPGWLWDIIHVAQYKQGSLVKRWTWHNTNQEFLHPSKTWLPLGQGQ